MHEGVRLRGAHAHPGFGHHAALRRHLLRFKGGHWMLDPALIEILLPRHARRVGGRGGARGELFVVEHHVAHVRRVVACALRLLHRHVAGVRAEQRVRLLALLDLLVLHTVKYGLVAVEASLRARLTNAQFWLARACTN
jgi:hypothetical protein